MNELEKLPNLGADTIRLLNEIGVTTSEQLKKIGSKQAWYKIKGIEPSACYSRLCGLEGAIQGIRWHNLSAETKKDLKDFHNQFKF